MLSIFIVGYAAFATLVFGCLAIIDLAGRAIGETEGVDKRRFLPKALVVVPCRGIDIGLEGNLSSLMQQNYSRYRVIAVVDSREDPALKTIRKVGMEYLVSNTKCGMCSGKVRAIATALEKERDYDAYAIADSDVRVGSAWLKELMLPLHDKRVGISTSFPRFVPMAGGFWSKMKLVWGFVGEGLMERESTRFGWGGSLAFRKDLLESNGISAFKDSKYSVSDDITLTKMAEGKGLSIAYARRAQPVVYCRESFMSFYEWSNRQTAFTILGYRRNLYIGLLYYGAEIMTSVSAIALSAAISPLFLVFLAHYAKSTLMNYRRADATDPAIAVISFAMPFIYFANLVNAGRMEEITWRGRRYSIARND